MPGRQLEIPGSFGTRLKAVLDVPDATAPVAYALFAHCFTCSKNFRTSVLLSQALTRRGFAVLRFDFTGLGESEGEFAATNFTSNVGDLKAAAAFLGTHYQSPALLFGHSFGGTAALAAAGAVPGLRAVATINSPYEPQHVRHLFCERIDDIERFGAAAVTLAGRSFEIRKQFLDDIAAHRMEDVIGALNLPLMIFHAPGDDTVSVENARLIYQAARHPKSYVSVDGADHFLRDPRDGAFVADMLATWAQRYLDPDRRG